MNPECLDICQSEWEIVQQEEATQTSNISIDRVLKPDKPRLPLPRNLSTADKSANTSRKSSITVFEFCQVVENPDDPGTNRIFKSTLSDDLKGSPSEGKSTLLSDRSKIRYYYCNDIIKPFLKPDCPESEEEILNNAIDSGFEDFPDYQPCEFPDSDTERIRACLSPGKIEVCTSITTNKSNMENGPVEPARISGDAKIEVEISTVPLCSLVDVQVLSSPPETELQAVPEKTCPCPQLDECIKPLMEICSGEDKKDKTEDKNVSPEINTTSCVCVTITTSSTTKCMKPSKEPNKDSMQEPNEELKKESNKKSTSTLECLKKPSKESIQEPNEVLKKESNKESPSTLECLKKASKESIKIPNKESPLKLDCGKKTSKESITKIRIECQNSLPPNVAVSNPVRPEKCSNKDGPTIEGFVDALDTHTKTLTTIKVAMQDFVGKFCYSKQASDKGSESPKRVSLIQKVFDVSDVDKKLLMPKISDVINSMKLKVDSTLSMISASIDKTAPEDFKTPVHSNHDLNNGETQDVGNTTPPAPVILPTAVPVSNNMFYTIKDKIVSMFREPRSDIISTRTSTFTNSSLESNSEADLSKTPH